MKLSTSSNGSRDILAPRPRVEVSGKKERFSVADTTVMFPNTTGWHKMCHSGNWKHVSLVFPDNTVSTPVMLWSDWYYPCHISKVRH